MSVDDARRWDAIHRDRQLPTISCPVALVAGGLVDEVPTSGRALDVACGAGGPSAWLAQRGLEVLGIDGSVEAIDRARQLAADNDLSDRTQFELIDLDAGLAAIVDAHGPFDLVLCQRFRDPNLYEQLAGALAPGGLLVITVLSTVGHHGEASPYRAGPGELDVAFGSLLDVIWSAEADGSAHLIAAKATTTTENGSHTEPRS